MTFIKEDKMMIARRGSPHNHVSLFAIIGRLSYAPSSCTPLDERGSWVNM